MCCIIKAKIKVSLSYVNFSTLVLYVDHFSITCWSTLFPFNYLTWQVLLLTLKMPIKTSISSCLAQAVVSCHRDALFFRSTCWHDLCDLLIIDRFERKIQLFTLFFMLHVNPPNNTYFRHPNSYTVFFSLLTVSITLMMWSIRLPFFP